MKPFPVLASLLLWIGVLRIGVAAQTDSTPKFEVSSVKPAAPGARGTYINMAPGGRVTIVNMPLKELIVIAYRVQPYQITGLPAWADSLHYDIIAKPESKPKDGELQLMLQSLLAERFGVVLHHETKEMPVYALVMGKSGKPGPGLIQTKEGGCQEFDRSKPMAPAEPGKPPTLFCGGFMMGRTSMKGSGVPLANFIQAVSRHLGRTVIDKTGLTGKFDINLEWTPDETQAAPPSSDQLKPPPTDIDASIFSAIQEQLGLKLQSQKGPVEILVIDKASKPDEN